MAILVDFENTIIQLQVLFKIVICAIIIFCIIYTILNNSKIKITEKDIAFCIGKRPFFENIKIELDKIKEISINYEMDSKGEEELTYYYNLDLIDYNFNAYRIIQSKNYNSICEFGNKIEKIIKKELVDKNDIEGYGHIFNKRIV
ncbi:hypothetical protein FACS1894147_06590 [Spirochaetia bacterium]|nr:hypothetical protein FACS1894147_06590 [Spirochaetia bacterium]